MNMNNKILKEKQHNLLWLHSTIHVHSKVQLYFPWSYVKIGHHHSLSSQLKNLNFKMTQGHNRSISSYKS